MFVNNLSFKGKFRQILSNTKAFILDLVNLKRRIILNNLWKNLNLIKKDKIIIIANGPSFTDETAKNIISSRENCDVMVINDFHLNSFSKELIPDYYLISDPQNIKTQNIEIKKNNILLKKYISNENIKYIAPYGKMWEYLKKPYLIFNDSQNLLSNNIDPRKPRGYRSNTSFKAIAISLALNYKSIYILGFDYEYPRKLIVNHENKIFLKNEFSFGEQLYNLNYDFESLAHAMHWWSLDYWHLRKLKSSKIINVTNNSMIDIFQRMSPQSFFEIIKK